MRSRVLGLCLSLSFVVLTGCRGPRAGSGQGSRASATGSHAADAGAEPGVIEMLELFARGDIDTLGPVIDLGEAQSEALIQGTRPLRTESVNGDSWAALGTRLRLRVPLSTSAALDAPFERPTVIRLRVRRSAARAVSAIVDGLLVRSASLPKDQGAHILSLPVPPDRFRRAVTELELRFLGPRSPAGQSPLPMVELDWVHLCRGDASPTRVTDLINDVRVEPTARRALTLYAPTTVSTALVIPPGARWTAAVAAEGPRGASSPSAPLTARLRAESDGLASVEWSAELVANRPWVRLSLDLSGFANRPVRLSITASEGSDLRLAVADLRIEHTPRVPEAAAPSARHVVLVVLRGARLDRFVPELSPRLRAGGFTRMAREGVTLATVAAAPGELSALVSATTGLSADLHRVALATDLLDEDAPTLASVISALGASTRSFTDDAVWVGSGADRGFLTRVRCPNDAVTCRAEGMFRRAADELVAGRALPSLTVIVTRAGVMPLDPAPEQVIELDPRPYEGTLSSAHTGVLAARSRRGAVSLEAHDLDRLGLLYDASLLGVDRGLSYLFERVLTADMDRETTVIVVGDRGTALGENGAVGDGPMTLAAVSRTVLLARGQGFSSRTILGVVGAVDAAATAIERLGAVIAPEMDGVSLAPGVDLSARCLPVVANARGELGVAFGERLGLPRGTSLGLYDLAHDPFGQSDLGPSEPITGLYAERAISALRAAQGRRSFQTSTRALEPGVAATVPAGH